MEVIYLISLTPTDLLHVTGEYVCYDRNIAEIALKKLADRKDMSLEAFEAYAESVFTDKICTALIQSMLVDRGIEEERVSDELIRTVFGSIFSNDGDAEGIVDFNCSFRAPLIGIGAVSYTHLDVYKRQQHNGFTIAHSDEDIEITIYKIDKIFKLSLIHIYAAATE